MFLGPVLLPQLRVGTPQRGLPIFITPTLPFPGFLLTAGLASPGLGHTSSQSDPCTTQTKAFSCLQPFQGSPCRPKPEHRILAQQAFTSVPASLSGLTCHPVLHPHLPSRCPHKVHPLPETQQAPLFPERARLSRATSICLKCTPDTVTSPSPCLLPFVPSGSPSSPFRSWQQPEHPFTGLFSALCLLRVKAVYMPSLHRCACCACSLWVLPSQLAWELLEAGL